MKVQVHEAAPSNKGASDPAEVIDSAGRRLTIKQPGILDESRLIRDLGEAASNQGYVVGYVMPAAMVTAIDGEPVPFPVTQRQVEAAIQRLDRHGLAAVMGHITAIAEGARAQNEEAALGN